MGLSAVPVGGMKISGNTVIEQPEAHSNPAISLQERVMFDLETHNRQVREESPRVQDRLLLSDLQDQHMPISTYAV